MFELQVNSGRGLEGLPVCGVWNRCGRFDNPAAAVFATRRRPSGVTHRVVDMETGRVEAYGWSMADGPDLWQSRPEFAPVFEAGKAALAAGRLAAMCGGRPITTH